MAGGNNISATTVRRWVMEVIELLAKYKENWCDGGYEDIFTTLGISEDEIPGMRVRTDDKTEMMIGLELHRLSVSIDAISVGVFYR